jgi:hypothetical protein
MSERVYLDDKMRGDYVEVRERRQNGMTEVYVFDASSWEGLTLDLTDTAMTRLATWLPPAVERVLHDAQRLSPDQAEARARGGG